MAFDAKISFTGTNGAVQSSMKVMEFSYGFSQPYDFNTNMPTGSAKINSFNVVLESSEDTQLVDWMIFNTHKNGKVEITFQNNNKRTVEFEDADCIEYHESFNYIGEKSPMHLSITFVARKIIIDGSHEHEQYAAE